MSASVPGPTVPGSTVGVLGSGQLGRMLALVAKRMGYRVHIYSPEAGTPAGEVADLEVTGAYTDLDRVAAFAKGVDVVTLEFENVPVTALEAAATYAPVRPGWQALHTAQNRLREKSFFAKHGLPHAPFRTIRAAGELDLALRELGAPAVLKTAGFGYDGKGQRLVRTRTEAEAAFAELGGDACILEAFVPFEREVSVVAARSEGAFIHYGALENRHHNHILDLSLAPAAVPPEVAEAAVRLTREVLEALDLVGVACLEFFLTGAGELLINELAPRPHNSGHLTLEACPISQFEAQLRAVCGLPLGPAATPVRPAAMVNLLGDLWGAGEPNWMAALAHPGVHLHLYGKREARPGRKMGHLTVVAQTVADAEARALAARAALTGGS